MALIKLDFTLDKYRELCLSALKSDYEIKTVTSYLQNSKSNKNVLVMRHDVDRFCGKALRMAILEQSLNLRTTYYFRKSGFSRPLIIKAIADMGHEIGYHYEALDEARGDYELAMELFKQRLDQLRKIAKVETVCMHGNVLTKWLNRDIWRRYDFRELGLIGEAYLSFNNIWYFSDTGRIWDMSRKAKDILPSVLPEQNTNKWKIVTTEDVITFITRKRFPRIYLTVHPERWSHNLLAWTVDQVRDTGMNVAKRIFLGGCKAGNNSG